MKYVRFEKNGAVRSGILEKDFIRVVKSGFFGRTPRVVSEQKLENVRLLAPLLPSKIIAVGLNYADHAKEFKTPVPEEPLIFLKPPSAVIGPHDIIYLPTSAKKVECEAELAIIIGKKVLCASTGQAKNAIFGYTCLNDVTARDLQKKDGQWARAKSFDTFCPIGPYIETELDTSSLKIELFINKACRQLSNTSEMVFDCGRLVSFISGIMTLEPGDVIATGTPAGAGALKAGDEAEVRIEKLGSLINPAEVRKH